MNKMRILALSSSRVANTVYLETAAPLIQNFLGKEHLDIAFIPFASADSDYESYVSSVRKGLEVMDHTINLVEPGNALLIIEKADVILVGGGNTFKLLHDLYQYALLDLIRHKVNSGTPYIGWSAGSNITAPTISTTNDMPIIEPKSFRALEFFPFQINPHYINIKVEGQHGETRDQRLTEFILLNPGIKIVGLPEGTALQLEAEKLTFIGITNGFLFRTEEGTGLVKREEIDAGADISFLL